MEVDILGTKYSVEFVDIASDEKLEEMEAYTDFYYKNIIVGRTEQREYFKNESAVKIKKIQNKILRHEIIHAFLYESGLDCNSNKSYSWAENEEMVDWFAIQSPKIFEVYSKLDIL